jgi:hypothetical protein
MVRLGKRRSNYASRNKDRMDKFSTPVVEIDEYHNAKLALNAYTLNHLF